MWGVLFSVQGRINGLGGCWKQTGETSISKSKNKLLRRINSSEPRTRVIPAKTPHQPRLIISYNHLTPFHFV